MDDPAYEAAKRRAEQLAALFANLQVVTEAELAAQGTRPVSVMHGDAETVEDADLIYRVLHRRRRVRIPGRIPGRQRLHHFPVQRGRRRGRRRCVHRPGEGNSAPVVAHHRYSAPGPALRKGDRGHDSRRR